MSIIEKYDQIMSADLLGFDIDTDEYFNIVQSYNRNQDNCSHEFEKLINLLITIRTVQQFTCAVNVDTKYFILLV